MGVVLRGSEGADVVCLRPLLALAEFEGHSLSLLEGFVPAAFDGGVVDEDVLTAVLGWDCRRILKSDPLAFRGVPRGVNFQDPLTVMKP
jgi:hypothetical protein